MSERAIVFPGEYCRVHIRVRAETALGQVVAVGGNAYELGFFDRDKVVHLVTTPESYPVWYTANPILLPKGQSVDYKYCIVEGGAMKSFEMRDFPRIIVPSSIDTIVEDVLIPSSLEPTSADSEVDLLAEIERLKSTTITDTKTLDGVLQEELNKRLIIVCYHLPVTIERTGRAEAPFTINWSDSLIAKSSKDSVSGSLPTYWMGTCKVPGAKPTEAEMAFLLKVLEDMYCLPIFLEASMAEAAYNGYCKQVRSESNKRYAKGPSQMNNRFIYPIIVVLSHYFFRV
jgi:trehalose 6-phosphate synthase/phosphatase